MREEALSGFGSLVLSAHAQPDPNTILENFFNELIGPAMAILWIIALVFFIYGFVSFLSKGTDSAGEARDRGKRHMIWGTVGMFFLLTASGIVYFLKHLGASIFG